MVFQEAKLSPSEAQSVLQSRGVGQEPELVFPGSGQGDLRTKSRFLDISVSRKRSALLLNRAGLLPATLPWPLARQGKEASVLPFPDQDTGGTKPRPPELSPAGNWILLKMRFGKRPVPAAVIWVNQFYRFLSP